MRLNTESTDVPQDNTGVKEVSRQNNTGCILIICFIWVMDTGALLYYSVYF